MRARPILGATAVALPAAVVLAAHVTAAAPDTAGIPSADARASRASAGWLRLSGPPLPALAGLGGAHPGTKVIRVNRTRAQLTRRGRQVFPSPDGTTILKTGRRGGAVTLVAVMRKVGRTRGDGGSGWRFAEYVRDGASEPFRRVGVPVSVCAGCHVQADTRQRTDWVFTRLR